MNGAESGFERLLEILDSLSIPYMVGGSLAAAVHGIPRSTQDVDCVAAVKPEHAGSLVEKLKAEFYIDPPEALRQSIRAGRMFNLIHLATGFKFDIYPLPEDPYQQTAFSRRALAELGTGVTGAARFYVASAEDTMLAKLRWYRAGGEVSERQWSDVLDIVRVQRGLLDGGYLRKWAAALGVGDLLEKALEAG